MFLTSLCAAAPGTVALGFEGLSLLCSEAQILLEYIDQTTDGPLFDHFNSFQMVYSALVESVNSLEWSGGQRAQLKRITRFLRGIRMRTNGNALVSALPSPLSRFSSRSAFLNAFYPHTPPTILSLLAQAWSTIYERWVHLSARLHPVRPADARVALTEGLSKEILQDWVSMAAFLCALGGICVAGSSGAQFVADVFIGGMLIYI